MVTILTTSSTPVIGWIASLLGILMNGIYYVISNMGIPNVGLAIILFTIILLMAMMPLQIRQQKFSKLNAVMQPELQKIQAKYKDKKDQASMQKMQDETQAVYAKYGVNPMGSCVQLLIQMPVLFALYQVIYRIPGYITIIGSRIGDFIIGNSSFASILQEFVASQDSATLTQTLGDASQNRMIDTVYRLNTSQWSALLEATKGEAFAQDLASLHSYIQKATSFLTLNISDSPMDIFRTAWSNKAFVMMLVALIIPLLAWLTQMLNIKLMPQPAKTDDSGNQAMDATMKSMNTMMPLMSVFFCFTLPVGVGIYWVASALVRSIQQFVINKRLDRESVDEIIAKAQEKANKKREKQGLPPQKITSSAHTSTRSLGEESRKKAESMERMNEKNRKRVQESTSYYNDNAKPGSLASKANMVKRFDEKKGKK